MVQQSTFPVEPKLVNVSPVFKSGNTTLKNNYRPISVLSSLSKVSERLLLNQFLPFMEERLSAILRALKKDIVLNPLYFLVVEMVCRCIDKGGVTARY